MTPSQHGFECLALEVWLNCAKHIQSENWCMGRLSGDEIWARVRLSGDETWARARLSGDEIWARVRVRR